MVVTRKELSRILNGGIDDNRTFDEMFDEKYSKIKIKKTPNRTMNERLLELKNGVLGKQDANCTKDDGGEK